MSLNPSSETTISLSSEEVLEIDVERIAINPFQPRREFAEEDLSELAASISAVGIIHPPAVKMKDDGITYELISGERRWRAAQLAGLKKIPVFVRHATDSISAQAALIENIQRVDLNPIEIAAALRRLIDEFGLNQEELSLRVGKKRSTVANYLRLLSLPKHIQNSVIKNTITMGHAKAILSLDGFEKQQLLFEMILRDNLTVRQTEEAALRISLKAKKHALTSTNRDFYLEQLAEQVQQALGTKVSIQSTGKKGKIVIDYYSYDDLDRLLSLLGLQKD